MLLENVVPDAEVITIDIEDRREPAARTHRLAERIEFLLGSSTDPTIVEQVRRRVAGKRVMVLLDSLHTKEHIAEELAAYAPMVSVGSYIVVQDSWFGGAVAVDEYVAAHPAYEIDRSRERFRLTNSVRGYVKRIR
jgi:cephalosporin hydroxylase